VAELTTFSTFPRPFYTTSHETPQTIVLEGWLVESIIAYNPTLIGAPENGIRMISGRLLTSPGDYFRQPDIEVSVYMYSVPALELIGFGTATSQWLLEKGLPCSDCIGLEDMVSDYWMGNPRAGERFEKDAGNYYGSGVRGWGRSELLYEGMCV
jgi:hypothetical protein